MKYDNNVQMSKTLKIVFEDCEYWTPADRKPLASTPWNDNQNVFFSPLTPSPKVWTPLGAQGSRPGICHEQTIFFIYIKLHVFIQTKYYDSTAFGLALCLPLLGPAPYEQGKVEITRCVIYVPAGSVNLWTGINEFVAAKYIFHWSNSNNNNKVFKPLPSAIT